MVRDESLNAKRIAWLLRSDVRAGVPTSQPMTEEFNRWWLLDRPREYPGSPPLSEAEKASMFAPLPGWPACGRFGMSLVLYALLQRRTDVAAAFDVATESGQWQAIAWLFAYGLREHHLLDAVDVQTLAALDETPLFFDPPARGASAELTWLMFFVWRASGLEEQFDLRDPAARRRYLVWFFANAVSDHELQSLVAPRWRDWLLQRVDLPALGGDALPRLALFYWQFHPNLQRLFNPGTTEGRRGLLAWFADQRQPGRLLSWLAPYPDNAGAGAQGAGPRVERRPFGINLIGFAFGELGIGEDVRMAVEACEAAGIPFAVVNIHPGSQLRQADQALAVHVGEAAAAEMAPYAINLFCLTGFDTARVYLERGWPLFGGRHNIGWWPWELPVWPRDWRAAFDLVDEVWAATEFTRAMYSEAQSRRRDAVAPALTFLMPLPASVGRVTPVTREDFGLPERPFLFLYVFDFNSYLARKNPFAAVAAFRQAFANDDDSVGLVLKTMNSNPGSETWQHFLAECAADPRIVLLDRTLDRGEVLGLIQQCDAYVSLHRSEGFGRTLAEAMLFGKPVVATDFSGTVDFLSADTGFPVKWTRRNLEPGDYPFVSEADAAWWAEPDLADAARQMQEARQAAADPDFAARIRQFAERQFSPGRIGALMLQRATAIHQSTGGTTFPAMSAAPGR